MRVTDTTKKKLFKIKTQVNIYLFRVVIRAKAAWNTEYGGRVATNIYSVV